MIGGSICGSSVAQILAPRFTKVIVLDRDDLPDKPVPRKGTPHSTQFHVLTMGGSEALNELFPGFTEDINQDYGAPINDPTYHTRYASKFGWFPRHRSGLRMLQATRALIEWYIRDRAASQATVEFVSGAAAVGLEVRDGRAVGVHVQDAKSKAFDVIEADLIVDASGRPSRAPDWLAAHGYPRPVERVVDAHWGYATVYVRVPDDWDPGWGAFYMGPTVAGEGPAATRGAAMWPQESNLMVITAQGCAGDHPPGDMESYLAWIRSFGTSEFADMVETHGAVTPVKVWRNTANRMRDYATLDSRPEGFIVLGDAAASFNPIYGQGMTVAIWGARLLRDLLDDAGRVGDLALTGLAQRFQDALQEILEPIWAFSTSSDLNVPGVTVDGVRQADARTPEAEYADRVLALATQDKEVHRKLLESSQLVRTFEWLADPELQARVQANWAQLGSLTRGPEPAFAYSE